MAIWLGKLQLSKWTGLLIVILLCGCLKKESDKIETVSPPTDRIAKLSKIKEKIVPFFNPMQVQEGDWLESFKEPGQTFDEYITQNPTLPTAERKTIYIQPIGDFTESQKRILRLTAEYMEAFYHLTVKLNSAQKLSNVPKEMKRKNPYDGQLQIKTTYFVDNILPKMLPADAAALICFTNTDLYPEDSWNFVFGQASFQNRVGVWSLSRFGNSDKSEKDYQLFLSRTLKLAMHETGHMFSMMHCTKYECIMSGTNHLGETDRRPLDACPECMAKIAWAMNYEPVERYRKLAAFWKAQNWKEEENLFSRKAEAVSNIIESSN